MFKVNQYFEDEKYFEIVFLGVNWILIYVWHINILDKLEWLLRKKILHHAL